MKEIVITPLGTVSPYCKDNMNCPGFLIEYDKYKLLLDCGNGITSLLKFPDDLNNLKVFLTHYHKDHIGDIGSIQYASYVYHNLGVLKNPIEIYLPNNEFNYSKKEILENKEAYSKYTLIKDNTFINVEDLKITFHNNNSHTIESFMIKLENNDFKIVYTSDIGKTNIKDLISFCNNSDLLICESSFLEKHKSNSKTHITALNAGNIAKLSNCKQLVLTHFWPEESKELYLKEAKQVFKNTIIAEENKKLILKK